MTGLREIALLAVGAVCACTSGVPGTDDGSGSGDGIHRYDTARQDLGSLDHGPDVTADLPSCQPNPFTPPGSPAGWKHTSTALFVVTQGAANHRGQDVVAAAGAEQVLIGKFAYGVFDKDLVHEEVEIFIQRDAPCGAWESLGVVETSDDGEHGTVQGIEDDGGRVFFTIPAGQALPVGRHPLRMLVKGDHSVAAFTLFVVAPGTDAVVFDIDGTLTTDDFELVSQLFSEFLAGEYTPEARPGGVAVAETWAQKGYLVVYLTGRPDFLRAMTRDWLAGLGAPPGPLHLTDTTGQALPTSGGVGAYKTAFLQRLASADGGLAIYAAYGNASTDIEAYAAASIPLERTFIVGDHAGEQGTTGIADYPTHLPAVQAMPAATTPAPPAVVGW